VQCSLLVFKLDNTGKETVLHRFKGGTDGWETEASLIEDASETSLEPFYVVAQTMTERQQYKVWAGAHRPTPTNRGLHCIYVHRAILGDG
jgi:hypothetical protein